ncbi:MAG TPA: hypothetical protein VMF91_08615 [Bryobacteraceae bacterium]|nr:hypothetical protein [Bryobacteraceae bacterium]
MTLRSLLDNAAVNVFLGTLPLLLTLAWGLFQSDRRLTRIENRLDTVDQKLGSVSERLVRVETKIDGNKVLVS